MTQTVDRPPISKSARHRRILDAAADQPEASLEAIASHIPSATAELVEHVLEEYGDPAEEDTESTTEPGESAMAKEPTPPDPEELTTKQLEILRVIAEHPDATQRELADLLDISAPTISNHVNLIPGFDWDRRQEIVSTVFEEESISVDVESTDMDLTTSDQQILGEQLPERISAIEDKLNELEMEVERKTDSDSVFEDTELAHKALHACFQSDAISEEEELKIMRALFQ